MLTRSRCLPAAIVLAGLLSPVQAHAFDFHLFGKKAKNDPAERVPALILQLRTDPDEAKRQAAAEELRQYDPKVFPEMMQALADALLKDASAGVRAEAATTIGKLRPVSQAAGYALEQAKANDASWRVRLAAQNSLLQYHLVGYRSGKHPENAPATGDPVTTQANRLPSPQPAPQPVVKVPRGARNESPEPPLASAPADGSRPMPPSRPVPQQPTSPYPTLTPVSAPKLLTPPAINAPAPTPPTIPPSQSAPQPGGDGPALTPPE
jgi:hypothetical protein